jgi:ABC-type nickel/cobalt efflux system permease component RcnA
MRWRADLMRLPAWARYGIAFAVLAVVVGIVLLVRPDAASAQPATWYTVLVRIGGIALVAYVAGWLVWRAVRAARRR